MKAKHDKLIALTRASRTTQAESPATQIKKIEEFCEKQNCQIVGKMNAFESRKKANRDTVKVALEEIRAGKANGIICTRLDRLAGNLLELLKIGQQLDEHRAVFVCTDQNIDTRTPEGKLFFHMLGAIAEFEHGLITARIKDGKAHAKAEGKFAGGSVPFGYDVVKTAPKEVGRLVEKPEEQRIIRQIIKWRDTDNCSYQAIADFLTEQTGKTWHRNQVVRIYERASEK